MCQRPFEPGELPAPLLRFGWVENAKPPSDSIFPLTDEEIDALAGSYFVARDDLLLTAGGIETTIAAGTPLLPADSFVAAMLKSEDLIEGPMAFAQKRKPEWKGR